MLSTALIAASRLVAIILFVVGTERITRTLFFDCPKALCAACGIGLILASLLLWSGVPLLIHGFYL